MRRFGQNTEGASAIEFAMVAPLFLGFVMSAFELGILYTRIATVELTMTDVARQVYTGQAQTGGLDREQIIALMCDEIDNVINCKDESGDPRGNVMVELLTLPAYSSSIGTAPTCTHVGEVLGEDELPTFSTAIGGDIVFMRFCITVDGILPGIREMTYFGANWVLDMPETADGKYGIVSSVVFRTEPFTTSGDSSGGSST